MLLRCSVAAQPLRGACSRVQVLKGWASACGWCTDGRGLDMRSNAPASPGQVASIRRAQGLKRLGGNTHVGRGAPAGLFGGDTRSAETGRRSFGVVLQWFRNPDLMRMQVYNAKAASSPGLSDAVPQSNPSLCTPRLVAMPDPVVWLCSNTYTALNALAGHYNNFGPGAPVPKKRLDRVVKVNPVDKRSVDVGSCLRLASSQWGFL